MGVVGGPYRDSLLTLTVSWPTSRSSTRPPSATWLPGSFASCCPGEYVTFFFVADDSTLIGPEQPLLVVPVPQAQSPFLDEPAREPFRVAAASLWAVESNLSLANLDWADFADHIEGGVYCGF